MPEQESPHRGRTGATSWSWTEEDAALLRRAKTPEERRHMHYAKQWINMTTNAVEREETWQYDRYGNTLRDPRCIYQWDALERLRASKCPHLGVTTYEYDGDNRRVVVTHNGTATRFVLDGIHEIEERDAVTGIPLRQFVFGAAVDEVISLDAIQTKTCPPQLPPPVGPILTVVATIALGSCTTDHVTPQGTHYDELGRQRHYLHQNSLGNVHAVSNATQAIVEAYRYTVYGTPIVIQPGANGIINYGGDDAIKTNGTSAVKNPFMFTGRRWDPQTNSYYYRARQYDPSTGRFLTGDPIGNWGDEANLGNGFSYVAGAPHSYTDPNGYARTAGWTCWQSNFDCERIELGYYVPDGELVHDAQFAYAARHPPTRILHNPPSPDITSVSLGCRFVFFGWFGYSLENTIGWKDGRLLYATSGSTDLHGLDLGCNLNANHGPFPCSGVQRTNNVGAGVVGASWDDGGEGPSVSGGGGPGLAVGASSGYVRTIANC